MKPMLKYLKSIVTCDQVIEFANDKTLYKYLYRIITDSNKTKEEKIAAYEALDHDRDNYDVMSLRNDIPFLVRYKSVEL